MDSSSPAASPKAKMGISAKGMRLSRPVGVWPDTPPASSSPKGSWARISSRETLPGTILQNTLSERSFRVIARLASLSKFNTSNISRMGIHPLLTQNETLKYFIFDAEL